MSDEERKYPPSQGRVYNALVVQRATRLPMELVRLIVEEIERLYALAASARRALLRHIRVARIIDYWLLEWLFDGPLAHPRRVGRYIRQMTERWLLLGGRSARYIRAERRYRYFQRDIAQWGIGSVWEGGC